MTPFLTFAANPYSHTTLGHFFLILVTRIKDFFSGALPLSSLATDEIQLIALFGIAASASLIGSFLLLKKQAMLANSLSHTILVGIAFAYLLTRESGPDNLNENHLPLPALMIAAILTAALTSFLTDFFVHVLKLQEDASIGIVFTSLFALGIILATLFLKDTHIGREVVMGNIDSLQPEDCLFILASFALNAALVGLFYKEYKLISFDRVLAKTLGISCMPFNSLLILQTAATVTVSFRAVGVLLVLSFLTGPVLSARLLTNSLKAMIGWALFFGCAASLLGVALSRHILTVYQLPLRQAALSFAASLLFTS